MPKVSVVIPSYNHGRYLERRFESILAQTFTDYEIVFLDDASTDESLKVFEKYRDHPKVRTFLNATNSGSVFKQWNKGVREARGEYVWFAESDDASLPRFLQTMVQRLDAHPNVGLAYANSVYIDENDFVGGEMDPWTRPTHPERWQQDFVNSGLDECRHYLVLRNSIPNASAVVFRRALYEQVGGADEDMQLCGDWATWVKLLLASDVAYVAEPLNLYRVPHAHSVRTQTFRRPVHLVEYLRIVGRILAHGPLPPAIARQTLDITAGGWLHQVDHADGITDPAVHRASLQAAHELGVAYWHGLLASVMIRVAQSSNALKPLEQRMAAVEYGWGFLQGREQEATRALGWLVQQEGVLRERLDQAKAAVGALSARFDEQAESMRFWNRLRRMILPPNSWRHRILRGFLRLVRRRPAA